MMRILLFILSLMALQARGLDCELSCTVQEFAPELTEHQCCDQTQEEQEQGCSLDHLQALCWHKQTTWQASSAQEAIEEMLTLLWDVADFIFHNTQIYHHLQSPALSLLNNQYLSQKAVLDLYLLKDQFLL